MWADFLGLFSLGLLENLAMDLGLDLGMGIRTREGGRGRGRKRTQVLLEMPASDKRENAWFICFGGMVFDPVSVCLFVCFSVCWLD